MTDITFMTGAKGGCGTTTVCANVAFALSKLGERTLFVDGDFTCGSGLTITQTEEFCTYTLEDVQRGACRLKQVLINHPLSPNLYILPTIDCCDSSFILQAVKTLAPSFDRVLCDGVAFEGCNRHIVVTEPYRANIKSMQTCVAKLKDMGAQKVELIVNKANGGLIFEGQQASPTTLAKAAQSELFGIVPEDFYLPLLKTKKSTKKAFEIIAKRLLGKSAIYAVVKPYYGVKGKIKGKMRYYI